MIKNKFCIGEKVLIKTYEYYEIAVISSIEVGDNEARYSLKDICVVSGTGYLGYSEKNLLKLSDNLDIGNNIKKINKVKKAYEKKGKKFFKAIDKLKKEERKEIKKFIKNTEEK